MLAVFADVVKIVMQVLPLKDGVLLKNIKGKLFGDKGYIGSVRKPFHRWRTVDNQSEEQYEEFAHEYL